MGSSFADGPAAERLASLAASIAARAALPPLTPSGCFRSWVAAFGALGASELEALVAKDALDRLAPRALGDSRALRALLSDDPAAPGLEERYHALLCELSALAAVFATTDAGAAPDPRDEYAGTYRAIRGSIEALLAASQPARPVWRLLREFEPPNRRDAGRRPFERESI